MILGAAICVGIAVAIAGLIALVMVLIGGFDPAVYSNASTWVGVGLLVLGLVGMIGRRLVGQPHTRSADMNQRLHAKFLLRSDEDELRERYQLFAGVIAVGVLVILIGVIPYALAPSAF